MAYAGEQKGISILLVDDSEDDSLLIAEAFREEGGVCIVDRLPDGEQALAYLRQQPPFEAAPRPDLILLDINMPRKNGFEVLRELKSEPELASIPVVMLTTSRRDEDVERSYAQGAASFVAKPLTFEQLREVAHHFASYWSAVATVPHS